VRLVVVIAASAAACNARSSIAVDAAPGNDARRDAPASPDARACTGGDGHATDANGNCFVFFLGPKTWVQAKAACEALPASFAKITSAAQNVVIEGLAHGHVAFFGATDSVNEGTFLWTDGSSLTYNNFRAGVPDNGGGGMYQEDCLVIEGNKTPDDTWDDRPCDPSEVPTSGNFAYLCEY
jgi:hypothetical protein